MRFVERFVYMACGLVLLVGCVTAPSPSPKEPVAKPPATVRPAVRPLPASEPPVNPDLQQDWNQALAHLQAGRTKEAEQGFLALTRRAPKLSGPYANLGLLYQRAGRTKEAIAALEKAIEVNPARAVYYNELGVIHRHEGQFDVARKQYRRALDVDPDFAPAHLNLAILYDLYLQEPKAALPHYQRYRELAPAEAATVTKWIVELERRIQSGGKPAKEGG
jgi:tetratricopeptide (TPR) repeat protein